MNIPNSESYEVESGVGRIGHILKSDCEVFFSQADRDRWDEEMKTFNMDEVVCPHCGYEDIDSWEFETGEYDCADCEKPMHVEVEQTVAYTTTKVEENDG